MAIYQKLAKRSLVYPDRVNVHRLGANQEVNDSGLENPGVHADAGPYSLSMTEEVIGVAGTATNIDNLGPVVHVTNTAQGPRGIVDNRSSVMSLQNILNTWTYIGAYTWDSTDATGDLIGEEANVYSTYLFDNRIKRKYQNFYRFNGTMEIMVMFNCSPTTYGHAVLTAYPLCPDTTTAGVGYVREYPVLYNCFQGRYGDLVPSTSEPVVIELPWTCRYPYIHVDGTISAAQVKMWAFRIYCVAPLASAMDTTATPSCTLKCYARMKEVSLDIPFAYEMKKSTISQQPKVSQFLKGVSDALGQGSKLPFVGGALQAASTVGNAVGSIAEAFGFSKVTTPNESVRIRGQVTGNMATCDGEDTSTILSLLSDNKVSVDGNMISSTAVDELAFSDLFARKTLVHTAVWSSTVAAGTVLFTLNVGPMAAKTFFTFVDNYYATPAGLIGTFFSYWRGTMFYEFKVYASSIHRGRLQIVYSPTADVTTVDPTNVAYTQFLDINVANTSELAVGWASYKYALATGGFSDITGTYSDLLHNGQLQVLVANPVEAKGDGDYPVVVEVYAYAGDDLKFYAPLSSSFSFAYEMMKSSPALAGAAEGQLSKMVTELVPVVTNSSVADVVFGEEINSARALFQKFYFDQAVDFAPPASSTPTGNVVIITNSRINDLRLPLNSYGIYTNGWNTHQQECAWTPLNVIPHCFLGWRGSLRYKIVSGSTGYNTRHTGSGAAYQIVGGIVSVVPKGKISNDSKIIWARQNEYNTGLSDYNFAKTMNAGVLHQYYSYADSSGWEFQIPYYNNSRFVKTGRYNIDQKTYNGSDAVTVDLMLNVLMETSTDASPSAVMSSLSVGLLYMGAGTDFSVSTFKFVPPLCNVYNIAES